MKNKLFTALAVLFALSLAACNVSEGDDTTNTTALPESDLVESTVQTETQSETDTETVTETETEELTTVHTHEYGEWEVKLKPGCLTKGKQVRTCSCGDEETEILDALGHVEVIREAVAPTCTECGLTEGVACQRCHKTLVRQKILAVEHNYVDHNCSKCGEPTPSKGLEYTYNSQTDSYTVAGIGLCTDIDIVISGHHNGRPVTGIEDFAFTSVDIRSLVIGGGINSIGDYAFDGCYGLTDLTISSSVNKIGTIAFGNCKLLENITVHPDNKQYYSKDNCLIAKGSDALIRGNTNGIIPEGVRRLNEEALSGYWRMKSVHIPSSVTYIEDLVFIGCSGIETLTVSPDNKYYHSEGNCIIQTKTNTLVRGCKNSIIPDYVEKIGDYAFISCLGLKYITIPDSVKSIGKEAFGNCWDLENVLFPTE